MAKKKTSKVALDYSKLEDTFTVTVLGADITVKSRIDFELQQVLISNYLENMFGEGDSVFPEYCVRDRFMAELALRANLLSHMTNIEFEKMDNGKDFVPEELLFNDKIFGEILSGVQNWESFLNVLYAVVEDVMQEISDGSALGSVLDDLVERLLKAFDDGEMNIDRIANAVKTLGEQIEESKVSGLLDEAQKA